MNFISARKTLTLAGLSLLVLVSFNAQAGKDKSNKWGADVSLIAQLPNVLNNSRDNAAEYGFVVIPPDPIIAAGPESVVVMVNNLLSIYRKDTLERTYFDSTRDFWNTDVGLGDVWAMYDEFSQRFFLLAFHPFFNPTIEAYQTEIFVAVSKTSTPQTGDDFYKYLYLAPDFADYPKMAIDREAVYISTQDFDANRSFFQETVVAFAVEPLVNNTAPQDISPLFRQSFSVPNIEAFRLRFIFPLQPRPSKCGGVEKVLFVQGIESAVDGVDWVGNILRVIQVKDVLSNPQVVYADVTVPTFEGTLPSVQVPQPAPQINSNNSPIIGIESILGLSKIGVVSGDSLWFTMNVFSQDGTKRVVARWYELDVSKFLKKNVACHVQSGDADPGARTNQIWPSINVDKDDNMAIQYTLVGEDNYPAIAYTGRLKNDPKGTVRLPLQIAQGGDLYYQVTFGGSRNRYGDYSGLAIDPTDHKTFWLFNQNPIAVTPSSVFPFGVDWTTFIGAFQVNKTCEPLSAPLTSNFAELQRSISQVPEAAKSDHVAATDTWLSLTTLPEQAQATN